MRELVVWSDVVCPWATVIVLRLHAARARADAADELVLRHRALPLELQLEAPLTRRVVDAEIGLCASLTPEFGWSVWQSRLDLYPVTSLPALEAVHAAGEQSSRAAEELDLALRRAFFVDSRCISMRHEVLAAARTCASVDVDRIAAALDSGSARSAVTGDHAAAVAAGVPCSGTVVLPDGRMLCNPGTDVVWLGTGLPRGTPVLRSDDPGIYDRIVAGALGRSGVAA